MYGSYKKSGKSAYYAGLRKGKKIAYSNMRKKKRYGYRR